MEDAAAEDDATQDDATDDDPEQRLREAAAAGRAAEAAEDAREAAAIAGAGPTGPVPVSRRPALPGAGQLLGLIGVVVAAYGAILIIRSLRSLLVMLLVALFIAFAVEPAVQWFARRGWRRGAATGLVFAVSAIVLIGSLGSIVPLLVDQMSALLRAVPNSVEELNDLLAAVPFVEVQLDPEADLNQELARLGRELGAGDIAGAVTGNVLGAAGSVLGLGATAVGLVFQALTVLLIAFYMAADGPRMRATLARPLPPHRQRELLAIWEIAVRKTGGYIYSRVLLAAVAAVVTASVVALLGIPYPLPLGVWVGLTGAFVPVIGTYLGGVLVLVVALVHDPPSALWVLGYLVLYQQLENYLVAPRLQSKAMDIHPAVAFVSVIVGATLLGAVGALLALPATAIIQAVVSTYVHRHELIDELIAVSTRLQESI